jgi:hypothetical protein
MKTDYPTQTYKLVLVSIISPQFAQKSSIVNLAITSISIIKEKNLERIMPDRLYEINWAINW